MILGAVLGLLGSALPEVFKLFKDHSDKKHEKEMLQLQLQMQEKLVQLRIQEAQAIADVKVYDFAAVSTPQPSGKWWIDLINALAYLYNTSVRPTVTYLLIGLYMFVKLAQVKVLTSAGVQWYTALTQVWSGADGEFVGAVVAFWFGSRQFLRRK